NTLPPGVTFVSASPPGFTLTTSGGITKVIFGNLGNLGAGLQTNVSVVVKPIVADVNITNTASCGSTAFDPLKGNNTATVNTIVIGPKLSFAHVGNNVVITWSVNAANYRLQSATNLNQLIWTDVTNPPPQVINSQYTVTVGITNARKFFRLIAPYP